MNSSTLSQKRSFLLNFLLALCFMPAIAQHLEKITIKDGSIQGIADNGLTVFKGIPFAAPPVGELRWKAPQPVKKWNGVLEATRFAPGPIQGWNSPSGKSEDCLYLNIWTPAKTTKNRSPKT